MHWDDGKTGMNDVNGRDLFHDYQSITETDVATSKTDRTNGRVI